MVEGCGEHVRRLNVEGYITATILRDLGERPNEFGVRSKPGQLFWFRVVG